MNAETQAFLELQQTKLLGSFPEKDVQEEAFRAIARMAPDTTSSKLANALQLFLAGRNPAHLEGEDLQHYKKLSRCLREASARELDQLGLGTDDADDS